MASPVPISDAADPRLADYASLTDVHLRRSLEAEHGLFVAEGEKVIRRATEAGYPVRSMLVAEDRLAAAADLAADCPAPVYVVPAAVAERLTGYHVHRGALASMRRKPLPAVADVVADSARIVVLEDIVDHANVGSIFRRSVKVSMGAVFAVPYARLEDWRDGLADLRAAGFRLVAMTPLPDAVPIGEVPAVGRLALLLGTEGDGLSARWLDAADLAVRIPMRRGVDSLNVAAAAAIACYLLAPR